MNKKTKAERRAAANKGTYPKRPAIANARSAPADFSQRGAQNPQYDPNRLKARDVDLKPKNAAQAAYIDALGTDGIDIIFATGPAGTGKTYLPSLYAIQGLKDGLYKRIIITRPIVPNGEDLGFLPGDIFEKMGPWVKPILNSFMEVMTKVEIESLISKGVIEIAPLAYMRGCTFKDAFVIADEMQNGTKEQVKMLLTRIGDNSRMVITGDLEQRDRINGECGLHFILEQLRSSRRPLPRFKMIDFERKDVERHPIITEVLELFGD